MQVTLENMQQRSGFLERWRTNSAQGELLVAASRGEVQRIRHVNRNGLSIDLTDAVFQRNQVAARGFSSEAGGIFCEFRLVDSSEQPTLFLQTLDGLRIELRFTVHTLVYAFLAQKFLAGSIVAKCRDCPRFCARQARPIWVPPCNHSSHSPFKQAA
jgi:hypothetical protein